MAPGNSDRADTPGDHADLLTSTRSSALAFHQQTVQRIEAGLRPVRLNDAYLMAEYFDLDLQSMTSAGSPRDQDIRFAVDKLRRLSAQILDEMMESSGEWVNEAADTLAGELYSHLSDLTESTDPQPLATWALAWAVKVVRTHEAFIAAAEMLADLGGCARPLCHETRRDRHARGPH